MSIYKNSFIITISLAVVSIIGAIILNYMMDEQFWCNVLLGVFGSALLTASTSIIGYFCERRKLMETFYEEVLKYLNQINKYQKDLSLEDKIDILLYLGEYDISEINTCYGSFRFFNKNNNEYIYSNIYKPLISIRQKIVCRLWNFRMHKNGTGKNDEVMKAFIKEIENEMFELHSKELMCETGDVVTIGVCFSNKLYKKIVGELCGNYYQMMYGKRNENSND